MRAASGGIGEKLMSRRNHDFSWHLLALATVIVGLSVLAPLTWWRVRHPDSRNAYLRRSAAHSRYHSERPREAATLGGRDHAPVTRPPAAEPQIAPLGPLIADQIDLDPSVNETPALPVPRPQND